MDHELHALANLFQQVSSLAQAPNSGIWVDSNVIMYSSKADKQRLFDFSELRTVPGVVTEVRKRPTEVSYLLATFLEKATVVGDDSFELAGAGKMFRNVFACCSTYSPLTRTAIQQASNDIDSISPFANNILGKATDKSTIFDRAKSDDNLRAKLKLILGDEMLSTSGLKKLKLSWRDYHNKREGGLRNSTYLWTDEALVASAITDAFFNNCISIILTTDWDPNVIMKQFADNAIAASVDQFGVDPDSWKLYYAERCQQFDRFLHNRRGRIIEAICDNDLFGGCQGGDVIIWQYPSDRAWFFSFERTFIDLLGSELLRDHS